MSDLSDITEAKVEIPLAEQVHWNSAQREIYGGIIATAIGGSFWLGLIDEYIRNYPIDNNTFYGLGLALVTLGVGRLLRGYMQLDKIELPVD